MLAAVEQTEVSSPPLAAGFADAGAVFLGFFCNYQLNSSRFIFALDLSQLVNCIDSSEGAADCRVHQLKPAPTVEKLLSGAQWGLKFS